jgi:hypothetical protein
MGREERRSPCFRCNPKLGREEENPRLHASRRILWSQAGRTGRLREVMWTARGELFPKELPLTPPPESLQHAVVSDTAQSPLQKTVSWLTEHTGFPDRRLPERAELLLLIAAAAEEADLDARHAQKKPGLQFNPNYNAQIRNYTAQRRRAHINCDNSAKT